MFAYEYYRRNQAILTIGKGENQTEKLEKIGGKFTTIVENGSPYITAFYDSAPKFSFQQTFNSTSSEIVSAITTLKNAGQAIGAAYDSLPGQGPIEKLKNMGKSVVDDDMDGLIRTLGGAASAGTKINLAPAIARWSGQDPISFSVKLIFLDKEGGPVYYEDSIKPLLSLVTFSGVDNLTESWTMVGPIGYQGTTTKFAELTAFLKQKPDLGLHSLQLKKGNQIILDLKNILVVENVNVATSEQMYLKPQDKKDGGPAYKWITADVQFKTACPIPGPYSDLPTNINNFYGLPGVVK
jgi:hypothetical protein